MKTDTIGNLTFYNADNLEIMRGMKDNEFDLAIVDPPYGINVNPNMGLGKGQKKRHKSINWDDNVPPAVYFEELFRISIHQIIWGGNYFNLPPTRHFIFWDKLNPEGLSFSDGEMAWTSFDRAIRKWAMRNCSGGKIHPTEKPIALYGWIIKNYAKPGDKILDTHLGSGSIAIAIEKANRINGMELQFTGIELNEEYYNAALQRFKIFAMQQTIMW